MPWAAAKVWQPGGFLVSRAPDSNPKPSSLQGECRAGGRVHTSPAGLPHPWGATSCRKAAPLTYPAPERLQAESMARKEEARLFHGNDLHNLEYMAMIEKERALLLLNQPPPAHPPKDARVRMPSCCAPSP